MRRGRASAVSNKGPIMRRLPAYFAVPMGIADKVSYIFTI